MKRSWNRLNYYFRIVEAEEIRTMDKTLGGRKQPPGRDACFSTLP